MGDATPMEFISNHQNWSHATQESTYVSTGARVYPEHIGYWQDMGENGYPLYLGSVLVNDMVARHPGCDRPLSPWSCETVEKHGRHVHILNKPEQLRGPQSPHRKDGTQNWEAVVAGPSVVACVLRQKGAA